MNRTGIRPFARSSSTPWVLSISPDGKDHRDLAEMINPAWTLIETSTLRDALDALTKARIAVVLCDEQLSPGSWKDILEHTANCAAPPHLIVTSRLADEALWAEALNLGAYDALAKPFESDEVSRVVNGAWNNWVRRYETARFSRAVPGYPLTPALRSA